MVHFAAATPIESPGSTIGESMMPGDDDAKAQLTSAISLSGRRSYLLFNNTIIRKQSNWGNSNVFHPNLPVYVS